MINRMYVHYLWLLAAQADELQTFLTVMLIVKILGVCGWGVGGGGGVGDVLGQLSLFCLVQYCLFFCFVFILFLLICVTALYLVGVCPPWCRSHMIHLVFHDFKVLV